MSPLIKYSYNIYIYILEKMEINPVVSKYKIWKRIFSGCI